MPSILAVLALLGLSGSMPVHQKAYYKSIWSSGKHDDMLLTPRQKLMLELPASASHKLFIVDQEEWKWPNNIVPYEFADTFVPVETEYVRRQMDELESKTCFKFVQKTEEHQDYIKVKGGNACSSHIGRKGGEQTMILHERCLEGSTVIHELMHALGVWHEQQRPDRDDYVTVNEENIIPGKEYNYKKAPSSLDLSEYPYDLKSVMHYKGTSFGRPNVHGQPSIVMTIKETGESVPETYALTDEDIRKLNVLGNCGAVQETVKQPTDESGQEGQGYGQISASQMN